MPERLYLSPPHMGGLERTLVAETFDSNWIAPAGPMIDAFEQGLVELTGIGHAVALSSGTAALHLALRLSGIGAGDEVWGSTMTFIGGVAPIIYADATPVFLDIEANGMLIDLNLLQSELATAAARGVLPKAVITTDLYGNVIDIYAMRRLADEYGFKWISDTAEAAGAYFDDKHAGLGADFVILSFNGNKIITTSGGGALLSDDADMIAQARFLSTQARDPAPHYEHTTIGYNYRLSNVCAAIGVGQLAVLAERVRRRCEINERYRQRLGTNPGIYLSEAPQQSRPNRWLTTILIDPKEAGFDREEARLALEAENIESRPLWKPMHCQPVFADARAVGGFVAERAFETGLCVPSGSAMLDEEVDRVCDYMLMLASR
ncbi:MAG: pyridoxal phosphate-dependent aminotransferase [Hyphomicrobiales bacterium]|nr:MAG: pyridoxal phosphate-dependent aminotransferase [Hyphomicrobiales bacterium]